MPEQPLISCLMVALPTAPRLEGLKRSVADYLAQTWARRELVIVLSGGDPAVAPAIHAHVDGLGRADIGVRERAGDLPLGALRNASVAEAKGEVVCQWDDDDRHHPERLARQFEALITTGADAVCLREVMQFFPAERLLYCDSFHNAPEGAFPGSCLGWRNAAPAYPETGEAARRGEDSAFVAELRARDRFAVLADMPHLYVYVSHGHNIWNDAHHRALPVRHAMSQGLLRRREAQLRAGLAAIDLGPEPVTVQGRNGAAFVIGGRTDAG